MPESHNRWQPSFGDLVGIVAIVIAVIVYVVHPDWQIATILTAVAIALVIFAAIRHTGMLPVRGIIAAAVVGVMFIFVGPPIWKSFLADYPHIALQWPVTFDDDGYDDELTPPPIAPAVIVPQPTIMPAPPGQRPLISSAARFLFSCHLKQSAAAAANRKAFLQKSLGPWGEQIGFDISVTDVPGGFRVTINASTDEAKNRFLSLGILPVVATVFVDVQRYDQDTIVVAHADLPKEYQHFTLMTPSVNAPQIVEAQKQLGLFLGGNDNSCHIF
jgi:hypothetical protein